MNKLTKKNIVWLASYPKSGNTWFRAFLTALFAKGKVNINRLSVNHNFANQSFFNFATQLNASELPQTEIDTLMPLVIKYLSENNEEKVFIKIHERLFDSRKSSCSNIPTDNTLVAIYLVRNPLDVAVSFAHHSGWTADKAIAYMNQDFVLNEQKKGAGTHILSERLGTWSKNVNSWTKNKEIKVHAVRYEDLLSVPFKTFKEAVAVIGLDFSNDDILKAIEASSFKNLRTQEEGQLFKEKNPKTKFFFRKGKAGSWRKELNQKQINTIIKDHYSVMLEFGYIP